MALPSRRFGKPCSLCRARRIACYPGSEWPGPCHRCETRGCKCDAPDALGASTLKDENELAEMRSQISRLDGMLQHLSGTTPPPSDPPSPASSVGSDVVEINDLIGAMTNLCFATEGLDGPISCQSDQAMVFEASRVLALPHIDELDHTGFVFTNDGKPDTLEAILAELPPWEETSQILTTYSKRWYSQNDALFSPLWFESVKELFASGFRTLRTPCQLAEIFGVIANTKSAQAVETGNFPKAARFMSEEAERHCKNTRRALDLANFYDEPCLESIRAMHLVSTLHLLWATGTAHFACAFAIIPAALAMAGGIGLMRADVGPETACQAYERRALITALARNDWTYPPSYGRPSSSTPNMVGLEAPLYLEDADLPAHLHDSRWRASRKTVQGLRARWLFAKMHREMAMDLFASSKTCDYSAVESYAHRLRQLEVVEMPYEWRREQNPDTGYMEWLVPRSQCSRDDLQARIYTVPKLCKVGMALHRPFIGPKRPDAGVVDEAWHRRELIRWARMSFTLMGEVAASIQGPFVAMSCSIFDTLIGLCLVLKHHPDEPLLDVYRDELSACLQQLKHPSAPPAIEKLLRLTSALLDKPRLRSTEESDAKKTRATVGLDKLPAQPRVPSLSPEVPDTIPFDFQVSTPVTPPSSATTSTSNEEDDLVHKEPLEHDFDRLAPFYHARTWNQLNNASSGLDTLATVAALSSIVGA